MFKSLKQKPRKKGQEEMIGFAVIIIVVAVVLLVFLYFSASSDQESVESYKSESYIQSILQYTTGCQEYRGDYMDVEDLIYSCANNETCIEGEKACEVLNSTLTDMIDETWPAGEKWPTKGYEFLISSEVEEGRKAIYYFEKGSKTNATVVKGGLQNLPPKSGSGKITVKFTTYERD